MAGFDNSLSERTALFVRNSDESHLPGLLELMEVASSSNATDSARVALLLLMDEYNQNAAYMKIALNSPMDPGILAGFSVSMAILIILLITMTILCFMVHRIRNSRVKLATIPASELFGNGGILTTSSVFTSSSMKEKSK